MRGDKGDRFKSVPIFPRNRLEDRSGTLWDGRYRSSIVDTDEYLLCCLRYIELNPVRAGMVSDPEDYAWSSFPRRSGNLDNDCLLDPVPGLDELGTKSNTEAVTYGKFVRGAIPEREWEFIRTSVNRGQATGGSRLVKKIQAVTGIRIERRGPGRPRSPQSPGQI